MSAAAAIAVVVVTHNSAATLRACLDAALAQPEVTELWVVDNASADAWRESLPDDPRVGQLHNAENRGFSAACNQGAAAARAPWVLFLNPDCLLPEGATRRLLDAWSSRPRLGLLGAQLLEADGSAQPASRRRTPTPQVVLGGGRPELPPVPVDAEVETVDATSGALMLLPRDLFHRLGGFDEAYRLHCEDLDLCRRVLQAGHEVGIVPGLRVPHLKGTSSRRRPIWVEWQKHRGMWRYYCKFDRAGSPWWTTLLIAAGLSARFPLAAARAWWRARNG